MACSEDCAALPGDGAPVLDGSSAAAAKATVLLEELLQGLGEEEKSVAGVILQQCLSSLESPNALPGAAGRSASRGSAPDCLSKATSVGVERELLLAAAAALRHHLRPSSSSPASTAGAGSSIDGPCCATCSAPACRRAEGSSRGNALSAFCGCACPAARDRVLCGARAASAIAGACVAPDAEPEVYECVSIAAGAAATAATAAATASPDFPSAASKIASNLVCAAVRVQLRARPPRDVQQASVTVLASIVSNLYGGDCHASAAESLAVCSGKPGAEPEDSGDTMAGRRKAAVAADGRLAPTCALSGANVLPVPLPPSTLQVLLSHAEHAHDEDLLLLLLAIAQQSPPAPRSAGSSPRHFAGVLVRSSAEEAPREAEGGSPRRVSREKMRPCLTLSDSSAVVVRGVGAASANWRSFCVRSQGSSSDADRKCDYVPEDKDSNGGHGSSSAKGHCGGVDGKGGAFRDAVSFKANIFAPADNDKGMGDDSSIAATRTSTMNDGGNVPVAISFGASAYNATVSTMTSDDYWGEENQGGTAFPVHDVKENSPIKKEGVSQATADQLVLSVTSDGVSTTSCCSSELSSVAASSFTCVCGRPACQLCGANEEVRVRAAEGTDEQAALLELLRKAQCLPPPGLSIGAGSRPAAEKRVASEAPSASGAEETHDRQAFGDGLRTGPVHATKEVEGKKGEDAEEEELLAAAALLRTLSMRCSGDGRAAGSPPQLSEADTELAQRFLNLLQACTQAQQQVADTKTGEGSADGGICHGTAERSAKEAPARSAAGDVAVGRELLKTDGSSTEPRNGGEPSSMPADPCLRSAAAPASNERNSSTLSPASSEVAPLAQAEVGAGGAHSGTAVEVGTQEDINGASHVGEWPEERTGDDVYRYGVLLRHLGRTGKVKACWTVWSKLKNTKGLQPNAVAYGCMYDALVSNGRVSEALELFEQMKREGQIQPNTIMYSTIIKGFAQAKQLDKALSMYAEMQQNGVAINTVTFNSIVDACARVGAMDKAAMLLEDMLSQGIKPDLITFSTIIKGYCVHGEMNKALHLLTAMRERQIKPDGVLYNSLLDGCVKTGRVSLCEYLWGEMQREDIAPSNFTLTILIKMHGRLYQLQQAFDLVKELPQKYGFSINAHVYTCLMAACIVNREYALALEVYDCMERDGVRGDPKTLSTIVGGCIKGRMIREAVQIVDRALDQMAPSNGTGTHCHGGDSGAAPHTGPALVDEKTLRFVVQQTKAHGLGDELGLRLVHKAISVGLLRGRNAAAAFHTLGSVPSPTLPPFGAGSAPGALRQRNGGRVAPGTYQQGAFFGATPGAGRGHSFFAEAHQSHRPQGYGFEAKNGNVMMSLPGDAEGGWPPLAGPPALHHVRGSSRACAPSGNFAGRMHGERRQRGATEDSFFSASSEALPSLPTSASGEASGRMPRKLCGRMDRRSGTLAGGWRGEGRSEDPWWTGESSALRETSDPRSDAAILDSRRDSRAPASGAGACTARAPTSNIIRERHAQAPQAPGRGSDNLFLPTLLNVHFSDVGDVHGNSQQTLVDTVAARQRGGVAAEGYGGSSCATQAEARSFGARPFPPGLGDEIFSSKPGHRRFPCATGGVSVSGDSTAAFSAHAPQTASPVEDSGSFLSGHEEHLAGPAQDNLGFFPSGARPFPVGKDKGRQYPERRRVGQMFFSGAELAAAHAAASAVAGPVCNSEDSDGCGDWVGGDGRYAGPQRGPTQASCVEGFRPYGPINSQPPPPPYCSGPVACEATGTSLGMGCAGRRRRHAPGQCMWNPGGKPAQKEGC